MRRRFLWQLFVGVGCFLVWVAPATAGLKVTGEPDIRFQASGPGGLKITGETTELSVTEDDGELVFTVPMSKVKTGIGLRDRHMREKYVEVEKYPDVTLTLERSDLEFPEQAGGESDGKATGVFRAHGQTDEVQVKWAIERKGRGWTIGGSFPFDISAHGIETPSFMGVSVDPEMKARARFRVVDDE